MKRLTITIAMLLLAAFAAPAADASSRQLLVMQDDAAMHNRPAEALDEFASFGTDVVKVNLYWDAVAPKGRRKPAGFDGANPASYSWSDYISIAQAIRARGMRPYFSLGGRAPDWATKRRGRRGTYRPSAREFGRFAKAAGQQFPDVDIWSIWNEPNLYSWLGPQRKKGTPISPSIYRGLYLAGRRGLGATGHGGDTILLGELMPRGGSDPRKVPPLEFLREMVCLDRNYHQYRGAAARKRNCRKIGRIPTSGLALHPYTLAKGPDVKEGPDEAAIGALARVGHTLNALARRGKLPGRLPIWITEFGYQTRPPDRNATPLRRAPSLMDLSEWIAFRNRRVASYSQYTLRDDESWQGGLRFSNGKAKRGVYSAFGLPVFVRSLGGSAVEVFGGGRGASPGDSAQIESKAPGASYRSLGSAAVNSAGYFRRIIRLKGASKHKFRVTLGGHRRVKKPVAR
jgi:hypothetical protein